MNFFITAIPHYPEDEVVHRRSRCFGYYSTMDEAKMAVTLNRCNMHEGLYNYIVVEGIGEGIHPEPIEIAWFRWNDDARGWQLTVKPEWSEGTINWAIG